MSLKSGQDQNFQTKNDRVAGLTGNMRGKVGSQNTIVDPCNTQTSAMS